MIANRLLRFIHKLTKRSCKTCRHHYHNCECDINIGNWADNSYCYLWNRR